MSASKSAAVFALDLSCEEAVSKGIALCEATALDKMVYAPHDELGLVFTGSDITANALHVDTGGQRYNGIKVARTIAPTTVEFITPLKEAASAGPECGVCDVLETIIVCASLLHDRTAKKKYARTIYLVTDAREEVQHKEEISVVLHSLQEQAVSLVVVGIDFTEDSANITGTDWAELSTKAQNERVLHFLCSQLGERSLVVSTDEALDGVHMLRRRTILQRPLLKVSLSIGDIRIATQMFTKASKQALPTMKRVLRDTGDAVGLAHEYIRVVSTHTAAGNSSVNQDEAQQGLAGGVVDSDLRLKAYYYGRTLIPCTEADLEVMRVSGHRSLDVLGFVDLKMIPPYILMGGTKALLPLAGDLEGQRGFASIVQAMEAEGRAAVVRFVRTKDAAPALALGIPSHKPGKREAMYLAPLPFAEDARLFRFSEFEDVRCTAQEEALVDQLVDGMTVSKDVLRPNESFNPVLAMYYATLKAKAQQAAGSESDDALRKAVTAPQGQETSAVPTLLPQLSASSTDMTNHANAISAVLRTAQPDLEACASAFPFAEAAVDADGKQAREYWFRMAANVTGTAGGGGAASDASGPTTINAFRLLQQQKQSSGKTGADDEDDGRASVATSTSTAVATMAGTVLEAAITRVSTIDPAHSFETLVKAARASAAKDDTNLLITFQFITDDLTDVLLRLLRGSFKDTHYQKCDEGVRALRSFCVEESLPQIYNGFLIQLMLTAQECGHGTGYWQPHVVSCRALHPITQRECAGSSVTDEAAAEAFLLQDRAPPEIPVEDDAEDDLLDLIS